MKVFSFFLLLLFIGSDSWTIREDQLFQLDLVHFNDFHARFEPTTVAFPECQEDMSCIGGFPRLYGELMRMVQNKPDALVLFAGDAFQGTYWYSLLKWQIVEKVMNLLPIDAHALGNHEFDDGIQGLVPYLKSLNAPIVAANIDVSYEPDLMGLVLPRIIVEKKGRKIGIIGLITPATAGSTKAGAIVFLDPIEVTKNEAKELVEAGVDIIIVLSHCGLDMDKEIAKRAGANVDIIVGGHSHSLLWKEKNHSPSGEPVSGPYPLVVESQDKPEHNVLIITASAYTKYLGNFTVKFDFKGDIVDFSGEPIYLDESVPEDPEIKKILQPYSTMIHEIVDEVVGYSNEELLDDDCDSGECLLGNLMADSFLDAASKYCLHDNVSSVAIVLRTNIRSSIPGGDIKRGSVINALPFSDSVVTFLLQGRHLVAALKHTLSSNNGKNTFSSALLPHVAGMKVVLNAINKSVDSVLVKHDDNYQSIDLEHYYHVTTVQFIAEGGRGFQMFDSNAINITRVGKDSDVLENYIRKISPFSSELDGRLRVVN